jgi:hypothetical protein
LREGSLGLRWLRRARACASALSHTRHVFLHDRRSPHGNTLSGQRRLCPRARAARARGACGHRRASRETER